MIFGDFSASEYGRVLKIYPMATFLPLYIMIEKSFIISKISNYLGIKV